MKGHSMLKNTTHIDGENKVRDMNGFVVTYKGTTAYRGVMQTKATGDKYVAFITAQPEDREYLHKSNERMISIGVVDDVLQAAYIVEQFLEDRDNNVQSLRHLRRTTHWGNSIPKQSFSYEPISQAEVEENWRGVKFHEPATDHFAFILKRVDMAKAIAQYGKEKLMEARKTMTVGQFLNQYM